MKVHKSLVGYDLYYFTEHIQDCINNKRKVPKTLGKNVDLGLLYNEHSQKIILADKEGKPLKSWRWPGDKLLFFGIGRDRFNSSMTFLYNDDQGNIVLEISLEYPWFLGEDPPADLYISYDDWLPEYKILYREIISKDVAQEWVRQLNRLYEKLEANMSFEKK